MLITEFDEKAWEEAVRKDGREEGREEGWKEGKIEGQKEGREEGRIEGRIEGQEFHLIEMICRKLRKGKRPTQIAEELEEDESRIRVICDTAQTFAPDYDTNKVFDALHTSVLQQ